MPSVAARFVALLALLRQAIAAQLDRQTRAPAAAWIGTTLYVAVAPPPRRPPLPAETWALLWHRLSRLANRFQTLFDRWRANTLPPPRPRIRATPADPRPATRPTPPRLPGANGWVNHRIPESAPPTGMLDALLHDPETERFVRAAPQAGRLLRPLCRALGVPQPPWLKLPPRPRKPRPRPEPRPRWPRGERRPSTHPYPMLPDDKPLQGYVRHASRAWKKTPTG